MAKERSGMTQAGFLGQARRFVSTVAVATQAVLLVSGAALAAPGDPIGPVIEVDLLNSGSTLVYAPPAVGMDRSGNFVVVWLRQTVKSGTYSSVLVGQRFAADGSRIGGEFAVEPAPLLSTGIDNVSAVRLAMNADGAFAVAWITSMSPGAVHVRAFDNRAEPVTPVIPILLSKRAYRTLTPDVAIAPDGQFAVAWGDEIPDTLRGLNFIPSVPIVYRANIQRFDAHGLRSGFPIRLDRSVNRYEPLTRQYDHGYVGEPRVVFDGEGRLSASWVRVTGGDNRSHVLLQTFDAAGRSEADPVEVSSPSGIDVFSPSIAADGHGRRLVAVQNTGVPPIGLQRFDRYGVPEQPVITRFGHEYDRGPEVAARPGGDFLLSVSDTFSGIATVQFFDVQGTPTGLPTVLAITPGTPAPSSGCVPAASASATAVVACTLLGPRDAHIDGIYVQRFATQ